MNTNLPMRGHFAALVAAMLSSCAVVEPPPLAQGHPASAQAPEGARPVLPSLAGDATTKATNQRLAGSADGESSKQMDHMKHGQELEGMDHSKMAGTAQPMSAKEKANPPGPDTSPSAYYTCPMHEQIKEAKPGKCPICSMTLVKKKTAEQHGDMENKQ